MSFVPIMTPKVQQQLPDVTVGTRVHRSLTRNSECNLLVFRFAGPFARQAGIGSATRLRTFWDAGARQLRLVSCQSSDPNGRAIQKRGGSALELRFPHVGAFDQVAPRKLKRVEVPVISFALEEITLDFRHITPTTPTHD